MSSVAAKTMEIARPGQYLTFRLNDLAYGLPIGTVREINRVLTITAMPETPSYVAGVMNLRGKILPIIDLRRRFEMPAGPYTKNTCIIVVDLESGLCGLLVDHILGVVNLSVDNIEPRPILSEDESLTCVNGMGKSGDQILVLLEISKVLSKDFKMPLAPSNAA